MTCVEINTPLTFLLLFISTFTGFPVQHGRQSVHLKSNSDCTIINLRPYFFYPDKPIHIQVTINHHDSVNKDYVHDASVPWIQNVKYENFQVCLVHAGHSERASNTNASFDWMAYQGAPKGGVTGKVRVRKWWTGTTCETVQLPAVSHVTKKCGICCPVAH